VNTAENPGLSQLADQVLRIVDPKTEAIPWRALLEHMTAYPAGKMVPPLKPPKTASRPRRIVAVRFELRGDPMEGTPQPVSVSWCDGGPVGRVMLDGAAEPHQLVAEALFTHKNRGALLALPDGAAQTFAVFLRRYARALVREGYSMEPLTAGATIRGLIVRKQKHSWVLCDVGVMTGLEQLPEAEFIACFDADGSPGLPPSRRLFQALSSWQSYSLEHFGSQAGPTVGRSALSAASRHLGASEWLWRAHPLAVAMLRPGGGYRGGYAAAGRYSGPAWRADMNKAYTWALGEPMPSRLGFVHRADPTKPAPGIYMCNVWGHGAAPIYLGCYQPVERTFERTLWHGGSTWAVLTSTEIQGIRELGYSVVPGAGLSYLSTFTLRGFVDQVTRVTAEFGRGSPQERIARAYGVSVYGKLAERPERDQVMYAAERPGDEWFPFVNNAGDELADLWRASTVAHRPHQHVDAASEITARVRSRLYSAIAIVRAAGGEVPHADTDGFLSSIDPTQLLGEQGTAPGLWRVEESAQEAMVWGAKGYAFGSDVRAAGLHGITPDMARRLLQGETMQAEMRKRSAPFGDAPLFEPLRRQVRAS